MEYVKNTCKMSLKKSDFPKICRMCLLFKDDMLVLHVPEVTQMVRICVDIEVRLNDGFPQTICTECFNQMHQYSIFRQQCKNSDEILHKIVDDSNDDDNYDAFGDSNHSVDSIKDELLDSKNNLNLITPYSNKLKDSTEPDGPDVLTKKESRENSVDQGQDLNNLDFRSPDENKFHIKNEYTDDRELLNDKREKRYNNSENEQKVTVNCEVCNKSIPKARLENHLRRHRQEKKHKCDLCPRSFKVPCELAKHLENAHRRKKTIECHECNKKFYLQIQLDLHLKSHFRSKNNRTCNICGKMLADSYKLQRHKKIHENREKIDCLYCDKTFLTEASLKLHVKRYHNPESNGKEPCPICGKAVLNIKVHTMQTHDTEKRFKCDQCNQGFIFNSKLMKHIREKHLGIKKEQKQIEALCPVCGRVCRSQNLLQKHLVTHDETRKYDCHLCSKTYISKDGLRSHLMVHKGIRPFSCSTCSKRFFAKKHLKHHILIHTGERPFACHICGRRFNQKSARRTHMKVHNVFVESKNSITNL